MNKSSQNTRNSNPTIAHAVVNFFPPMPAIKNGQVSIGANSPLFVPTTSTDSSRLGREAQSAVLLSHDIADSGLTRVGANTPAF